MDNKFCIELAVALTIPAAVIGLILTRVTGKRGIGVRAIQFVAVATIVPAVVILALEGLMQGEGVAAILGATVGYLLSNISNFDKGEGG